MAATIFSLPRKPCSAVTTSGRFAAALCLQVVLVFSCSGEASAEGLYFDWPVPWFIERPTTTLYLSGEIDQSTNEAAGFNRERDTFIKELELGIYTRGYVYHPALLLYNLRLRPEFRWQDQKAGGNKSSSNKSFLGYAIRTTWLKDKPYTVALSAERIRSDVSNLLAADTVQESATYAGSVRIKLPSLPTTISYTSSDNDSSGFYPTRISEGRWHLSSIHNVANSKTELNIEQAEYARSIGGTLSSSEQFRTNLRNRYRLGNGGHLVSSLGFLEGNVQNRNTRSTGINSRLSLDHRQNLESNYSASYTRFDDEDRFSRSAAFSAGLNHQLYENLSTSVSLSSSKSDSDTGAVDAHGGGLTVAYARRMPWGRLRIYRGYQRSTRDDQREATLVSVRDEAYVFEGITTSIILEDVNIDADSIILTDATGLVVYVLGVDYEVDVLGITTIITRSSFGGIADDQTVLVDYFFAADPPAKTIRSSTSSGVQLYLGKYLDISYDVGRSDERVVEGTPPEFPLDSEARRLSAQLRLGRSITRFELRDLDSARAPQKTRSITETLRFQPGTAISLDLSAAFVQTELKDTGEISKSYGINAGLGWGFGQRGRLKASAFVRQSRSSFRHQQQQGLTAEYLWRFGAWRSRIHFRLHDTANEFEDNTWSRRTLYFETSRRFN